MSHIYRNTVFLVRHGENPANITKEFSSILVDYSLTDKGVLQAHQTGLFFRDKHIDEIYASPLKRARETASIIGYELGLPITVMEEFREIGVGDLERRPPTVENWRIHDQVLQDWYTGKFESRFPEGENLFMVADRLRRGLKQMTLGKQNKRIILVGHGGLFMVAALAICHQSLGQEHLAGNHNCSVTELDLETTEEEVSGTLRCWAAYGHLSGLAAQVISGSFQYDE
ncbi:putative phosphoglycerate mutase [Thermosporothrix hazakensis]|jgi:broad specificity phosphatase PhoE|uniref:Putative phosphoglycerate mutase n=1 Tax=Thermosporothrix hazakensis TaxID=644383 RepID=A0A326UBI2_THEHA|nr:histidine phosphatase family protein [Thermosporothrix hazakensis]PZW30661.1 putative phosphoglycerate mutase [Thermosporothrix hazakensis]GCE49523.1 putative phosphatase PhoE [Thermosporothrix hazakensis]